MYVHVDRQKGRFAGFSLYVSQSDVLSNADIKESTLCYKDGAQLPPLNFTAVCTENGRYVIYYNERLQAHTYPVRYEIENVFTELCEVIVLGKLMYVQHIQIQILIFLWDNELENRRSWNWRDKHHLLHNILNVTCTANGILIDLNKIRHWN